MAGLSARPFSAARHEVMLRLMRPATHYRDSWVRRLRAPARMRPPLGDRFLMDYYPRPLQGGPPLLPYARRPHGCHPGASHSPPRSAATLQGRVVALTARSAWNMGRHHAPGAKAWAGASAATAGRATKGTLTPRQARAVRGSRPGSRRAARCLSPRTGAQERRRCPPGWDGPAQPPKPSRPRGPRRLAGACPPPPPPPKGAGHPPLLCTGAWQPQTPETTSA